MARQRTAPAAGAQARDALAAYAAGCVDHLRSTAGADVRRWLTETRAIPQHVLDHAGVGADPGTRKLPRVEGIPKVSPAAVFPIRDNDEVIFTLSRAIRPVGNLPRWVNTSGSIAPNPRLAIFHPRRYSGSGAVVVTEGVMDALSVVTARRQAAAILGTGLVDDDVVHRLAQLRRPLLIATDNDPAGCRMREMLLDRLDELGARVSALVVPERFNDLNDWHVRTTSWQAGFGAIARLAGLGHERAMGPPSI